MKIDYLKIINNFVKNTKPSSVESEGTKEAFKYSFENKNAPQTKVLAEQTSIAAFSKEVKFNLINRMEYAKLLKTLLGLPNEIEELLSFLVYKKNSTETLEMLIKQNHNLNTEIIRQMLMKNSKESMNKLLKLFQQAPGGTQNTEQIKEILALLTQMVSKKELPADDTLRNLILLYLPWVPLAEKQNIEIRLEQRRSQEEDSEQTVLIIYITTINIGKFKISILINKDFSVKIEIENTGEAGKENLESILKEVNLQVKKDRINAKTEILSAKKPKELQEEKKRKIIFSSSKDVSPIFIITAQKIAKIIFEIDEKISLLEKREQMNNN